MRHCTGAWHKSVFHSAGPSCNAVSIAEPPARCRPLCPAPVKQTPQHRALSYVCLLCVSTPIHLTDCVVLFTGKKYQIRHWCFIVAISAKRYNLIGDRYSKDIHFLVVSGFMHRFFFVLFCFHHSLFYLYNE